jgi:glucose-1-phosphate thymidylyltransferase
MVEKGNEWRISKILRKTISSKRKLMKGIILAGGSGTRLYPITKAISKQLMPIYDKPMIYYPLSVLMMAGIHEILIITTPEDNEQFIRLLGDGADIGCKISYAKQEVPNGLAQAFVIGEKFIGTDKVALILGDNIFYGSGLGRQLQTLQNVEGGYVFAYPVSDPERYGVVEFDENFNAKSIEEKPVIPKSKYAVPGLYFEITDVNKIYLAQGNLKVTVLDRTTAWLDTGTFDSLHDASEFVRVIEKRQGTKIGCIEEIAFVMKFINEAQLKSLGEKLTKSGYGHYLLNLIKN